MNNRLNLHIDETGNQNLSEGLYLVAIVLHKHSDDISKFTEKYENRLRISDLTDVPFHGKDLLHGNKKYSSTTPGERKRLLSQFSRLVREFPFTYFTLCYVASDTRNQDELEFKMRRDLESLIYKHLIFFQAFDNISVYYDNGQKIVSAVLHDTLDYVLAKHVANYRNANYDERRLLQIADYICTIERTSIAYEKGKQTKTQERFFGTRRTFRQGFMKQLERKRFCY